MRSLILTAALALIATGSLAACGCDGEGRERGDLRDKLLAQFDTDGDGQLSQAEREAGKAAHEGMMAKRVDELKTRHPELFAKIDANGDGTIDMAERQAAKEHFLAKHPGADGNGDGKLDRCEVRNVRQEGGAGGPGKEHADNGRRAHGDPAGNGHDHGRRGPGGE